MENNLFLSKFWTRIWALLIDSIILGIFGFILGLIFKDFFISLGESAKAIGWIISLAYFTILNSKLYKGGTFGKKIMRIQVTDIKGNFIDVKTSFIRSLIFTTPFFLNGFKIPGVSSFSVITTIQAMIIFTIGLGIIVFYIFNKQTRQSIHDIISKTYVVRDHRNNEIGFMPKIRKLPFYITGAILLITIGVSIYSLSSTSKISKLIPVYEEVLKQDNITNAAINMNYTPITDNEGNKRFVYTVTVYVNKNLQINRNNIDEQFHNPELIETVKTFINSNVYDTDNDILNVVVVSGYDIGIAKQYASFNFYKPISEWKKVFGK